TTQLIQIAGWGIPTTLKGLEYASTTPVFCNGLCVAGLTVTASTTNAGDNTVVVPSALWVSADLQNVSDYWVDIGDYNRHHLIASGGDFIRPFGHKDVLELAGVLNLISDSVTNSPVSPTGYEDITSQAPLNSKLGLRYELHSPLSLNLFDV